MPHFEGFAAITVATTAAFYLAAWLGLLRGWRWMGWMLFGAGWMLNAGLIMFNWIVAGEPPFGNMYHVQVVLSLCFLPMFLLLAVRERMGWTGVYFAFVSALPLIGALFMEKDMVWRRLPALQSPWLVPHVLAYMISYALASVAFVMTMVYVVRRKPVGEGERETDHLAAAYATLRYAFPFMTFGLLSGALWAENAWGAWWSWDPKETWSLITWSLYVIYFHCQATPTLRRFALPAQALAYLALLTTFFLVNLLPKLAGGMHSYA